MTEAEWLNENDDPIKLLVAIRGHRSMRKSIKQRKQRLFAVACCWRIAPLLDDERIPRCIEVAESLADVQVPPDRLRAAEAESNAVWLRNAANDVAFACHQLFWEGLNEMHISTNGISAVFRAKAKQTNTSIEPLAGRVSGAYPPEARAQCDLIRCIFGNPFQKASLDPSWRTEAVVALARGIYEERAFERLPVLADALDDAGCANADVLAHCRGDGPHARGCWVVDLILGKA